MHAVAILRLGTSVEDEARSLAADLGTVPYELRLKLNAGVPAVVLQTADGMRASRLVETLTGRGHDAVACAAADVVRAASMLWLKQFRFDPGALVSIDGAGERLAWEDIAVLVRAIHRTRVETTKVVTQKRISPGRVILTGGMIMNKTTTSTTTGHAVETEPVLYVFARTGSRPWLLREQHAHYDALGGEVTPTSSRNFELVIDALKTRAPQAWFDDRLVARRAEPDEVDLLAHLIAGSRAFASPFR